MKFLLDECVEYRLVFFLQKEGHDVTAIGHDYPHSLPDPEVLALAYREQRILITNDRSDFDCGIILFSLKIGDIQTKQIRLQQVINEHSNQLQHFIVITPQRVKIRKTAGDIQ